MGIQTQKYYSGLAGYFQSKPLYLDEPTEKKPNTRKLVEQPWQQTKAEMWDEVTETLCSLDFIQAKAAAKMTYELVDDFSAVLLIIPENQETIKQVNRRQERMAKYIQDLVLFAKGEIETLEIPENINPRTNEQYNTEIERIKNTPNRADRLTDFITFLRKEVNDLQNYSSEYDHFATQQAYNFADTGAVGEASNKRNPNEYKFLLLLKLFNRPPYNPLPPANHFLKDHSGTVISVSITPDGQRALSGSTDNTCIFWDINSGKALFTLKGHTDDVLCVSMTPDGQRGISCSKDNTCILWDLTTGRALHTLKGHADTVHSVSITPDGQRAISCSKDNTCILWDLNTCAVLLTFKGNNRHISITSDGKVAIYSSYENDHRLVARDLKTGKVLKSLIIDDKIEDVSITPDGTKVIASVPYNPYFLWNLTSGEVFQPPKGSYDWNYAISITADGKMAVSGTRGNSVISWDLVTGGRCKIMKGHTAPIESVSITPDGRLGISGSEDNTCIIWNIETGIESKTLSEHLAFADKISITPDGGKAISFVNGNSCVLWDLKTGEVIQTINGLEKYNSTAYEISITTDGQRAILQSHKNDFFVWNLFNGKAFQTTLGDDDAGYIVSITPTGQKTINKLNEFTSSELDYVVTGRNIKEFVTNSSPERKCSTTPDRKCQISYKWQENSKYHLENMVSGETLKIFKRLSSGVLAISPNGKYAISRSLDNTCDLWVWDIRTEELLVTLKGHTAFVRTVAILPDGTRTITGSDDRTAILWDLKSGKKMAIYSGGFRIDRIQYYPNLLLIIGDSDSGIVKFLCTDKNVVCPNRAITTIQQIWDFELQQFQESIVDCPLCGHRFPPPGSVLDKVINITKTNGLRPDQSPCMQLPHDAWEDPGLLSNCPICGEGLKFNPFIVGGE
jgi:WD40 repeat protein